MKIILEQWGYNRITLDAPPGLPPMHIIQFTDNQGNVIEIHCPDDVKQQIADDLTGSGKIQVARVVPPHPSQNGG